MVSEICYRCHENKKMGPKSKYCKDCHAAYTREWRKTHKLSGVAKKKDSVRSYLNVYVKRGKIFSPEQCERCNGKEKLHAHHYDYNKPLDVIWVCIPCHKWIHENESDKIIDPVL